MNSKLLLTGLGIIFINTLLIMIFIIKIQMPYALSIFVFTLVSLFLYFILLRKNVAINIKSIDTKILKSTLALFIIPLGASSLILMKTPSIDYAVVGYLLMTSLLISVYEEILFRAIGLGSFLSADISPVKAIILSSIIFSICHLIFVATFSLSSIFLFLNTFAMGFILGYIYYRTKNIAFVIGIHFIWDFTTFMNQRLADVETSTVVSIILLAVTILYLSWSTKGLKKDKVSI